MLIDNVLMFFVAFCLFFLVSAVSVGAYFIYKLWKDKQSKPLIVEIEGFDNGITQGFGLIVNGQIILRDDQKPLLFEKESVAKEILQDRYYGQGEVVYQKWDTETKQLKIGKVISNGSNQHKKSQSHAGRST